MGVGLAVWGWGLQCGGGACSVGVGLVVSCCYIRNMTCVQVCACSVHAQVQCTVHCTLYLEDL